MRLLEKHTRKDIRKFLNLMRSTKDLQSGYLRVSLEYVVETLLMGDLSRWGVWYLTKAESAVITPKTLGFDIVLGMVKHMGFYKDARVYILNFTDLTITPTTWAEVEVLQDAEQKR